jgi:hypothetical protein
VYKKNKNVAFTLLSLDPQIPIIKNIGIKILSKKIKKTSKSVAEKDKIRKISTHTKYKQKSLIKIKSCLYEVRMHNGMINALSKTKNNEMPSMPKEITYLLICICVSKI